MKTIVTHFSPDLDAIASTWLVKKYLPGWITAKLSFVPAGLTLNKLPPEQNPDIIHVDTGFGAFDHHQSNENTCATKLVFEYLNREGHVQKKHEPALLRMVEVVNTIDHFGEFFYPEPAADRYQFMLYEIIEGMKSAVLDDVTLSERVFPLLDGVFQLLKNKVHAEAEIKQGFIFDSAWGKSIVMETKNEETMKLSLMMGYHLVGRRDPDRAFIRVKTQPRKELDLSKLYEKIKKTDPQATWFFHASKHMLLNGSAKNPASIPSILSVAKLIEIIKSF